MSEVTFEEVEKLGQVQSYLETEGFHNVTSFAEITEGDRVIVMLASDSPQDLNVFGICWSADHFQKLCVSDVRNDFMTAYGDEKNETDN
jgi:hypothetical protein